MTSVPPSTTLAKRALRKRIATSLATLSKQAVITQSAAVLAHLAALPAYSSSCCAAIFLPMDGGCEVDTWPIVADLLSRGVTLGVPRVTGPTPADMRMLRITSLEQAQALPRTKWGIPEPDDALAASMEDMTAVALFDLLLVPCVALDARCNRLGHGRGYYDAFIQKSRARIGGSSSGDAAGSGTGTPVVVGLALAPQLVDEVPVDENDQRLDFVVSSEGRLAYASAADVLSAAGLREGAAQGDELGGKRAREATAGGGGLAARAEAEGLERVELAAGRHKYVCLRVSLGGESFLAVRSG